MPSENAEAAGNFVNLQIFIKTEHDDFAMRRRKPKEAFAQNGGAGFEIGAVNAIDGRGRFPRIVLIDNAAQITAVAPARGEENAVKPRVKRGLSAEARGGAHSLDKGFLDQVLGIGLVSNEQEGAAQKAFAMGVEQFLDRRRALLAQGGRQSLLVHIPVSATGEKRVQMEK